jgi:hypothetical protein
MGMSTNISAFISSENENYKNHAEVLKACVRAGISKLPQETAKFFGSEYATEYLLEEKLEIQIPFQKWDDGDMRVGYEILVKDIPKDCYKIRFYNSY